MSDTAPTVMAAEPSPSYAALQEENRQLRMRIQQMEQAAGGQAATHSVAAPAAPHPASAALQPAPVTAAVATASLSAPSSASSPSPWSHGLTSVQISRYSRQLLLSELGGADTQARLLRSHVLVVGAGGLGAPVCLYLAAAGVGHITIVDGDEVELSNLHRQVMHTEASIGQAKALSAARAIRALNSDVRVTPVIDRFTETNALQLASAVDLIVDASDNVATRYLVNDVGVVLGKPVVSGSALRLEGQVSVFHLGGGPCYRCLYPTPPPASSVTNCSDGGVLGAVTGIIGSIQAMEVVKILAGLVEPIHDSSSGARSGVAHTQAQAPLSASSLHFSPVAAAATMSSFNSKLLLFDGSTASFRSVKLRPRNRACAVCGDAPSITRDTMQAQALDYQLFCGSANHDKPATAAAGGAYIPASKVPSASVVQLRELLPLTDVGASASSAVPAPLVSTSAPPLLLDVREPVQFRICALPGAVNVPLRVLKQQVPDWLLHQLRGQRQVDGEATAARSITPHPTQALEPNVAAPAAAELPISPTPLRDIFVMCRRGVDSVRATRLLMQAQAAHSDAATEVPLIRNVAGGLQAWQDKVDAAFPLY